ncbi:MAG: hypothetical protein ACK53Y_22105, partial [bacterium]
ISAVRHASNLKKPRNSCTFQEPEQNLQCHPEFAPAMVASYLYGNTGKTLQLLPCYYIIYLLL